MSEHKIQSGKGNLSIEMDQVPKILKPMVDEWTKDGYIVSFKLETGPSLLKPKSRTALERYGHQVVIGNDLHRRKYEVVFVSRKHKPNSRAAEDVVPEFEESWLRIPPSPSTEDGNVKEIEEDSVNELVRRHDKWIQIGKSSL